MKLIALLIALAFAPTLSANAANTISYSDQISSSYEIQAFGKNRGPGFGSPGRGPGYGGPGYGNPGYGSRPVVSCSVRETGWEEHWGGHRTCQECLRKHGQCRETCSTTSYVCEARGIDYRGYEMSIFARANSRVEASNQAHYQCQRNYRNCQVRTCTTQSDVVSTRTCR